MRYVAIVLLPFFKYAGSPILNWCSKNILWGTVINFFATNACARTLFFIYFIIIVFCRWHMFQTFVFPHLQAIGRSLDKQKAQADVPVQEKVYRSTKVWSLYLDLEESLGTVETAKAAYDRVLELKVQIPRTPCILSEIQRTDDNKLVCTFIGRHAADDPKFRCLPRGEQILRGVIPCLREGRRRLRLPSC